MNWYERYMKRLEAGDVKAPHVGQRVACPCCGYLTLTEAKCGEICELCLWEDNGQDDAHADEQWFSTNGYYSLTRARQNFKLHLSMYEPEDLSRLVGGPDSELERATKRELIAAFEAMPSATDNASFVSLWQQVFRCEHKLDEEVDRRIAEHKSNNPELATYEATLGQMIQPE
jgi:hypothetical protein